MRYYSKRELYALGEMLGDSVTEHKVGGGRIYGGGGKGGGGGGAPTQTTSTAYQTSIPEYARPYVETMLGATQKQLFNMDDSGNITGFQPYKPYSTNPQDYVAPFSPMQQQAQQGIANLRTPGAFQSGTDIAGLGAMGSLGAAGQASQAGNQLAEQSTNPYAVGAYMNPYIQNALNPALQLSNQQYGIKGAQEQSAATQAGAFGGSRNALMQGLNQQNQMLANNQLIGNAYNQAYNQAQQQMNQVAGLGLQGQQAAMQGYGQAANAANTMAGIAGQGLQAQQGIYGLQNQVGASQQAQQQQMINQAISDYANAQQYPLMQLGVMSNMLRGLPMQAATTNQYVAAPNPVTQGIGLAGAGASIYNALKAKGGVVDSKKMASGGIASYRGGDLIDSTENDLYDMPVESLQKELKSPSQTIRQMAQRILKEKTGKAGGGIIAFADGNDGEAIKEDPAMVRQAYIDAAKAQAANLPPPSVAAAAPAETNTGIGRGRGSVTGTVGTSRFKTPEPSETGIAAAAPPDVRVGRGAVKPELSPRVAAARAFEERQKAAPVEPAPVVAPAPQTAPAPAPQAAAPAPVNAPAPAPVTAAPAAQSSGIKAPTTLMPTSGIKDTESIFGIKPPEQKMESLEDRLAAYGENEGNRKARENIMAERANARDEAKRATNLRMAEFFGAWGSTPGNTIVAGLNALKNKIPDFITDMKEEAKIRRQIDKDIADLDKLDREEKNGIKKDYFAERSKMADRAMHQYGYELSAKSHMYSADKQLEAARVRGEGGEGNVGKMYNQAVIRYQTETKNIEAAKKEDREYKMAVAKLAANPKDADALATKNKKEAEWNARLEPLKEDMDYYKKKAGREIGEKPAAPATPEATNVAKPTTEKEYNNLPKGAHYIDPNGVTRIKG